MANQEQVNLLTQNTGAEQWNQWRAVNPDVKIDLSKAVLKNANLENANLKNANLNSTNLENVNLKNAKLNYANLNSATSSAHCISRFPLGGESTIRPPIHARGARSG